MLNASPASVLTTSKDKLAKDHLNKKGDVNYGYPTTF